MGNLIEVNTAACTVMFNWSERCQCRKCLFWTNLQLHKICHFPKKTL